MDPNPSLPEQQPEPRLDAPDQLGPVSLEPPSSVWSGAAGAVVAIAVSGLLIVGLWAVSRNAPSAGTDPRLAPPATATAAAGQNPFGEQVFVTVVPEPAPLSPATAVTYPGDV